VWGGISVFRCSGISVFRYFGVSVFRVIGVWWFVFGIEIPSDQMDLSEMDLTMIQIIVGGGNLR